LQGFVVVVVPGIISGTSDAPVSGASLSSGLDCSEGVTGTIALFGVAGLASALVVPGLMLARQRRRRRHQALAPALGPAPNRKHASKHRERTARRKRRTSAKQT
jgi:hypothetical protein